MSRALAVPLILIAACTDAGHADETDAPGDPSVSIVTPAEGSTVSGPDVELQLEIVDFELTGRAAEARAVVPVLSPLAWITAAAAHEDGDEPGGFVSVRVDGGDATDLVADHLTLTGLGAGAHEVEVELLWPDGDAFYPAEKDRVTFTVE